MWMRQDDQRTQGVTGGKKARKKFQVRQEQGKNIRKKMALYDRYSESL